MPLILASGDRLARALREDENLARRAAGLNVWEAPQLKSLRQWLQDAWADAWPSAQLLNSTQSLALWLNAVERGHQKVIGTLACAREALAAERLCADYALALETLPAYSEEQRAWRAWQARVARRKSEQDWITAAELPALVAEGLKEGRISAPQNLRLAGFFAAATPAERAVFAALGAQLPQAPAAQAKPCAWRVDDAETQCRLIAETVRLKLAPFADREAVPPRILIVVPDGDARRALLEDALSDLVAPWLRQASEPAAVPWRWDRGATLADSPWSEAALALLALEARGNEPQAVSRFLLAPLLWRESLRAEAAALDARLRESPLPRYGLARLAATAGAGLRGRLQALADLIARTPASALPSTWAAHFTERLALFGWPAVDDLSSAGYQSVQEFRRELARLGGLDAQTGAINAGRARLWLNELLKRRFVPRAEHSQPILIAAPEDALGLPCELLIVADADAAHFPGAAHASPFLPIEAQAQAGMPEASPQAWLAHRRAQAQALLANAQEALLLAPGVDERGGDVLPSPLFDAEWSEAPERRVFSLAERMARDSEKPATPESDPVPAVAAAEQPRGDAGLFHDYAEAPFFAFCTHRLGIRVLPEPPRGLTASLQGKLLHEALEVLWKGLADHAALNALDAAALGRLVDAALAPIALRHLAEDDYGRQLVRLEVARLADLLRQWLAHEQRRVAPFAVIAWERKLEADFAGLRLSLRVDRVDEVQTPHGPRRLVLDYKTGREADPKGWNADSLREPQLPLYAVLLREAAEAREVDGIAFAHLKDGHPTLSSRTNWSLTLIEDRPCDGADWPEALAAWRDKLESFARGFLTGCADLDLAQLRGHSPRSPLLLLAGDPPAEDEAEAAP